MPPTFKPVLAPNASSILAMVSSLAKTAKCSGVRPLSLSKFIFSLSKLVLSSSLRLCLPLQCQPVKDAKA